MTQKMIRKRDGRLVEFHTEKIRNAIWRSFLGVGQTGMEDVSDALARKVETMLELEGCEPEVEHVQDLVEQVLMQEGYGRTAKAYILYRAEHTKIRNAETYLMDIYKKLTYSPALKEDIKRENANIDGDTAMGTMLKYGSEGSNSLSTTTSCPSASSCLPRPCCPCSRARSWTASARRSFITPWQFCRCSAA